MDEKTFQIPEDIKQVLLAHPFHKVAGALYGVDFENEHAVFQALGEKLAKAMLEQQAISDGLVALKDLQKEAAGAYWAQPGYDPKRDAQRVDPKTGKKMTKGVVMPVDELPKKGKKSEDK